MDRLLPRLDSEQWRAFNLHADTLRPAQQAAFVRVIVDELRLEESLTAGGLDSIAIWAALYTAAERVHA
jgi:hypothetical protein